MKLGKLIQALGLILKKPYLLNEVLNNEERFKNQVVKNYGIKTGLPEVELETLGQNLPVVEPFAFLDGGSLPTDLMLLNMLCSSAERNAYFEIGTWRGESVSNVAKHIETCYTLNQSTEEILQYKNGKEMVKQIGFYSKDLTNVNQLTGNSFEFDFSPYQSKMDVVFIDGDHSYEGVKNDTKQCFPLVKDDNSVIVWHDYGHNPGTTRWEVLQGILDGLPQSEHQYVYSVKNTICAIYTKQKLNTSTPVVIDTPKSAFKIAITKG